MNTWLVADHHLGEDRFDIMGRPFEDPNEQVEFLIKNHNSRVKQDDLVYFVGDICYNQHPEYLKNIERFNGSKILIRGNHDRYISDNEFLKYFDSITPEGDGIELDVENIPCYLTHYPTQGREDRFNLVGHVHGAFKYQLNSFNVCVDVNHYYPVNLKTIPFHLKAITEYYDADVWVAYNKINSSHYDKRGKKTSYFVGHF